MTSYAATEIITQPETWLRAAELARDPGVREALPQPGERVALVGCGSSLYMSQACARIREDAGHGETDAFPASEFPFHRDYDRVIALTRSGTTTEVVRLLERLRSGQPSTVITTDRAHPVVQRAGRAIVLDFADERSVVQTRFGTAVIALWRTAMTGGLGTAVDDVRRILATPLDPAVVAAEQVTFLGTGWTVALANEAALKIREAAQSWAESYPAMEFRHGPISVVDERSVVWVFGQVPTGLAGEIAERGARLVHSEADPLAHLAAAQQFAVAVAERKGLDPDHPRGLARSIVLKEAG